MLKLFTFLLVLSSSVFEIHAGWIIVERTTSGNSEIAETTLYINKNVIKTEEGNINLIFDLNHSIFTVINQSLKGYWSGTPDEYLDFLKEYTIEYLEEQIRQASDAEKEELIVVYEDLKLDLLQEEDAVSFIGELPVDIVMTDNTEKILGYRANQFIVYVDGTKVEEVWLTSELKLADDYDYEAFRKFVDKMSWGSMFENYRSTENYIHLMKTGVPLRTLEDSEDGTVYITEVVNMEQSEIPVTEFRPPLNFKPMSLSELDLEL